MELPARNRASRRGAGERLLIHLVRGMGEDGLFSLNAGGRRLPLVGYVFGTGTGCIACKVSLRMFTVCDCRGENGFWCIIRPVGCAWTGGLGGINPLCPPWDMVSFLVKGVGLELVQPDGWYCE